jgi:hypothetical protein
MKFFSKIFNKNKLPKAVNHPVVYAFTIEGVDYYQFEDFSNIPALRGLKTMVFYEEIRMKCTMEYLKMHTDAIENILSKTKIDVFEIKKLNDQMKQRLNMAVDTDLVYKLASVVFFDKNENIEEYDFAYNKKKIDLFKQHPSFFLLKPLQELLPVLKDIGENLLKYSKVVTQLNKIHLDVLSSNLPVSKIPT